MSIWDTPSCKCPYCGAECEADWVDVGVGMQQCGPYHCTRCFASEIHPLDERQLSEDEKRTGWYEPQTPPSPRANTFQEHIVDHETATALYEIGLLDKKDV